MYTICNNMIHVDFLICQYCLENMFFLQYYHHYYHYYYYYYLFNHCKYVCDSILISIKVSNNIKPNINARCIAAAGRFNSRKYSMQFLLISNQIWFWLRLVPFLVRSKTYLNLLAVVITLLIY